MNKLQKVQNTSLRIATGCTKDTNINHLHQETKILLVKDHLQLHGSILRQKAQLESHPLHNLTTQYPKSRQIRETIFQNKDFTRNHDLERTNRTNEKIKENCTRIHTEITEDCIKKYPINKVINQPSPPINEAELSLPRETRRTLAQLRTGKSPILFTYKHKIDPITYPSPLCPLCKTQPHDVNHLFNCIYVRTTETPITLWNNPIYMASLLKRWGNRGGLA